MKKAFFNWSSGKDAAMALHALKQDPEVEVDLLLTSINAHHDRISMHGLRRDLLMRQVEAMGMKHTSIELAEQPSMEDYEAELRAKLSDLHSKGYRYSAFGDIFLEDLKKYREDQLASVDFKALFPLWKKDTRQLIDHFVDSGFKATIVALNAQLLDESFLGREIDHDLLKDLPDNVDPCGENGEFHTFCYDGPIFDHPIAFEKGEHIFREYKAPKKDAAHSNDQKAGFWFLDLK